MTASDETPTSEGQESSGARDTPSREELDQWLADLKTQDGPGAMDRAAATYRQRMTGWDRDYVIGLLSAAVHDVRNAWRGIRLTIAMHAAAGLAEGGTRPSTTKVKSILDKAGEGTAQGIEDPLEGPYVWQVRMRRSHRFICGPMPDDAFYLPGLWKAAEQLHGEAGQKVRDSLVTAATVSEIVAQRTGLPRVAGPGRTSSGQIYFPPAAFKRDVGGWSYIVEQDVKGELERPEDAADHLDQMCTTWAEVAESSVDRSPLLTRPLLKDAGGWRVISAQHLARTAMATALRTAKATGVLDAYLRLARQAFAEEAITWCERLGWVPVDRGIRFSDLDDMTIACTSFWTSQRAAMHVVVASHVPTIDALEDPDQGPTLELPAMAGRTGLSTMLSDVRFTQQPDRERQLVVLAAPASNLVLKESDCLPDVTSLEILSLPQLIWAMLSHRRDPRFLIRFWQNRRALEERGVHIVPDEFTALCAWSKKESLYLSDDARPSLIVLDGTYVSAAWQDLVDTIEPCYVERDGQTFRRFRLGPEPELTIHTRMDGAFEIEHDGALACIVKAPDAHRELARMVSFWFWDLTRELPASEPARVAELIIDVGPESAIRQEDCKVIITFPDELYADATHEERGAGAALDAVGVAFGADVRRLAQETLDQRLANPLYRHQRATEDPTLMAFGVPRLDGPSVREAYRDTLMDFIGLAAIEALDLAPGIQNKAASKTITEWVWPHLLDALRVRLEKLDAVQAVEFCLAANEAIIHRMQSAEFHQAYDETLWASLASFHEEHVRQWTEVQRDALSSRFLLECLVAMQRDGEEHLDDEIFEELLSLASSVVAWGYADETLHFDLDESPVHVLKSYRVAVSTDAQAAMGQRLASQQLQSGPRSHLAEAGGAPSIEPVSLDDVCGMVDDCLANDVGFTLTDMEKCLQQWIGICVDNGGKVTKATRDDLLAATTVETGRAEKVLDALTLRKRAHLLPEDGADHGKILPWVFNRNLSLLWRPVVKVGDEYLLAFRLLGEASEYQIHQFLQGRGPRGGPCEKLVSHVTDLRARALTHAVAALYGDTNRYRVVENFKAKNKVALPKQLGDIDVLVFDRKRSRIEVIEAKNYYMAKTPREIHKQNRELFVSQEDKPSMAERHERRVQWVKDHVSDFVAEFQEKAGRWSVRGTMVMGGFSVHGLKCHDVPVISFDELRDRFASVAGSRQGGS